MPSPPRTLRVLTLRRDEDSDDDTTPALSSNYLRVHIPGILPPNLSLEVVVTNEEGNYLVGEPTVSPRVSASLR